MFFKNRHISGALAELIRSTRAPTKDRLIGKIMGGNPAFRGTRVPVHLLAELCPRAHALPEGKCEPSSVVYAANRVYGTATHHLPLVEKYLAT